MNTGRNLTIVSVGIIVYVLSGADFQSAGVAGISWDIEYPGVIKLAAVVFWFWLVVVHWLTRRQGEYYRAWSQNATNHQHGNVQGQSMPGRNKNDIKHDLEKVATHFGVQFNARAVAAQAFGLVFVDSINKPGIYVAQCTRYRNMDATETGGFIRSAAQWQLPPISDRIGFVQLHWRFPDVLLRTWINNPEVLSHRVLPWVFAAMALGVLLADQFTEIVSTIGPWTETIASDTCCGSSLLGS